MSILKRVEKGLDEKVRKLFAASAGQGEGRELLEIHRGILDEVAGKVQTLRRGKRAFPFNHLIVHIIAREPERHALLLTAFGEGDELTSDIREVLKQADCDPPKDLHVDVIVDDQEGPESAGRGFHVTYDRQRVVHAASPGPHARLQVLGGKALQEIYELGASRLNVGRLADIVDDQQRLVRRNHVVFTEDPDPANATVSRSHAHIRFDAASGEFRLFDDQSAFGTSVFRNGALVRVPSGAGRGVVLHDADEIFFGQAHVRFETTPD